ncbi:Hypothetical predicted protein [Xyrichtys novacula]|uniref:Uncharacterized protein n=1 Tax=Xyrichtys novacula TaxID=13765 RepID=A0AAV1F1T4_XYRNO|nr:Hypothetical predicted protein [Xyrichtys novacula]
MNPRRSVKTKACGDKLRYSRQASPNPFERPLRHLRGWLIHSQIRSRTPIHYLLLGMDGGGFLR